MVALSHTEHAAGCLLEGPEEYTDVTITKGMTMIVMISGLTPERVDLEPGDYELGAMPLATRFSSWPVLLLLVPQDHAPGFLKLTAAESGAIIARAQRRARQESR